ncbi:9722_t:CDS:2, partial [Acaulospora colombiana]
MLHRMGRKLSLLKLLPRRSHVEKAETVTLHIGMKTEVEVLREEVPRKNSRVSSRRLAGATMSQSSLKKGKVTKDDSAISALPSNPSSSLKGKRVTRKPAPIFIPPLSTTTHVIHPMQPTFVFPADYSLSSASQSPPIQSDDDIIPSLCSEYLPNSTGDMHSHFMIAPSIQMGHTEAVVPPCIPVAQPPTLSAPLFPIGPANETRSISPSQLAKHSATKRPQIHRVGAMLRAIFGSEKGRRHAVSIGRKSSNKRKKMNRSHPPSPKRARHNNLVEEPALSVAYQLHGVHLSTSQPLPHYGKKVREIEETSAGSSGVLEVAIGVSFLHNKLSYTTRNKQRPVVPALLTFSKGYPHFYSGIRRRSPSMKNQPEKLFS